MSQINFILHNLKIGGKCLHNKMIHVDIHCCGSHSNQTKKHMME